MSHVDVMRCIRDALHHEADAETVRAGDRAALAERYGLDDEELSALLTGDVHRLDEMGVHPFSLIQLSRVLRFDIGEAWMRENP